MKIIKWILEAVTRFSYLGLLLGGLFLAASLTPSLIPRNFVFQGVLAGVCFAIGYSLGVLIRWLWQFFELPEPRDSPLMITKGVITAAVILLMVYSLRSSFGWQNSIRELMGMELLETGNPIKVALVALVIAWVLILLGRWIVVMTRFAYHHIDRYVPQRVAIIIGPLLIAVLLVNLFNGVIVKNTLQALDKSYAALDSIFDDGIVAPTNTLSSGSPGSFIDWDDLGRRGREFVVTGPTVAQISAFNGKDSLYPIRLYVGLNSGDTIEERAQLALAELIRVDAFSRKVLLVVTPTGTGWVDPMGANPVEYIHNGDIASVAVQYSYLSSPISLLAQPEKSRESARIVFSAIYDHWRNLPRETRPALYLNGLSLGSHGSEASWELYKMLGDPIQGAFWAGPPFANVIHRRITVERQKGSPAWLPLFQDSSLFRFTTQTDALDIPGKTWGPMRIVYLQYPSDPIVFFDLKGGFQMPAWMLGDRGPDVSPEFTWYPIVTFVQLLLDMGVATSVPFGFGHNYDARDYIDGWVAVTKPQIWSEAETVRLKKLFANAKAD